MARKSGQKPVVEVHKFGGASLADGAAYRHAAGIVQGRGAPAIAVVSAPAGVTDALLALAVRAAAGEKQGLEDGAEALRRRYREILAAAVAAPKGSGKAKPKPAGRAGAGDDAAAEIDRSFAELASLLQSLLA